jgi:hypothetical protein
MPQVGTCLLDANQGLPTPISSILNKAATAAGFHGGCTMSSNVGMMDRMVRIVVGLALIAFTFRNGLPIQGWSWAGLIGIIPLLTGTFGICPAYSLFGYSSCESRK